MGEEDIEMVDTADALEAMALLKSGAYPPLDHPGISDLVSLGVLKRQPIEGPDHMPYAVLDPLDVGQRVLEARLKKIVADAESAAKIPAVYAALARVREAESAVPGIHFLANSGEADNVIASAMESARRVYAIHNDGTPRKESNLKARLPIDLEQADRVQDWRVIYTRAHRSNKHLADWGNQLAPKGVEIRTTHEQVHRVLIIDDQALIMDVTKDVEDRSAWHIEIPSITEWMAGYFEALWKRSERWIGGGVGPIRGETISSDTSRRIMHLYLEDKNRAEVAKAMGVHPTRINQLLEPLYKSLGIKNLHALLAWFVQSEERHLSP
ncbi:hypothetical protein [Streptomyces sp. NPDC051561]|uniref:hypothetical protein n=1 Tax=Streptomyces sp. NPDC051561 TaxID=3365658 RepID=UPI00379488A5